MRTAILLEDGSYRILHFFQAREEVYAFCDKYNYSFNDTSKRASLLLEGEIFLIHRNKNLYYQKLWIRELKISRDKTKKKDLDEIHIVSSSGTKIPRYIYSSEKALATFCKTGKYVFEKEMLGGGLIFNAGEEDNENRRCIYNVDTIKLDEWKGEAIEKIAEETVSPEQPITFNPFDEVTIG